MSRALDREVSFDRVAEEIDVAQEVEQFMASRFIGKERLDGVEDTVMNADGIFILIEQRRQTAFLLIAERLVDENESIIQVAALDEVM